MNVSIRSIAVGLVLFSASVLAGCGGSSAKPKGTACTFNSDCSTGLVCTFGLCHEQCLANGDCMVGMCIKTTTISDAGVPVTNYACETPTESHCAYNSDCKAPLVCGRDEVCRNQCVTTVDCAGTQVCTPSGVCALPATLDPTTGDVPLVTRTGPTPDGGTFASGSAGASGAAGATGAAGSGAAGATGVAGSGAAGSGAAGSGAAGSSAAGATGKGGAGGAGGTGASCATTCGVNTVCVNGTCQPCGTSGAACCGSVCNANLTCVAGTCSCGGSAEACCNGTSCSTGLSCISGTCSCGGAGQNCCATDPKCTGSLVCGGLKCGCTVACDLSGVMKYDGSIWAAGTRITNTDNSNFIASKFSWNGSVGCAIKADTSVWCWGNNSYGTLGAGLSSTDLPSSTTPVQVILGKAGSAGGTPLMGATAISVGDYGSYAVCAVGTGGGVYCWGYGYYGQLGNNTTNNSTFAVPVVIADGTTPFTGATQISLSNTHACALHTDTTGHSAWCWGDNSYGQLGLGSTMSTFPYASQVTQLGSTVTGVVAASPGGYVTCASIQDGSAWCWGNDTYADLGDGNYTGKATTPTQVKASASANLTGVSQIIDWAGQNKMCAFKNDASIWCWGGGGSATYAYPTPLTDSTQSAVTNIAIVGRECYLDNDDQAWYNGSLYTSYQVTCP